MTQPEIVEKIQNILLRKTGKPFRAHAHPSLFDLKHDVETMHDLCY